MAGVMDPELSAILFKAARNKDHDTIIHILNGIVDKGERTNIINTNLYEHSENILFMSLWYGLPFDLIKYLIGNGAEVNKCSNGRGPTVYYSTPLIVSLLHNVGDFKIATLLINNGADINYNSYQLEGDMCHTALEAVIKDVVVERDGLGLRASANQVDMKKKILNFLFNTRDSEGHRVQVDYDPTIFELAKLKHGPDFEKFVRQKFNNMFARNITAAKAAWMGNKGYTSERSGFGKIPEEVLMGPIAQLLGGPKGPLKRDGTHAYPHPETVLPLLRGVTIPNGQRGSLAKLYNWAKIVRSGTRKAAEGLVSPSQGRYYVLPTGKTVRTLAGTKQKGGR